MKAGGETFKMGRTIRNGWGLRSQIKEIRSQKIEGEERSQMTDRRGQVEEIRLQRLEVRWGGVKS